MFFFNFVTDFYCFSTSYYSNLAMPLFVKHTQIVKNILHRKLPYISVWKHFDCKFYVFGNELKYECSFFFFLSLIQYVLCEKLWISLLQWTANVSSYSVVSFDISIYSLNIVQLVVRMRSNKNRKMRHYRKKIVI